MLGLERVLHILLGYIFLPCLTAAQIFVCPRACAKVEGKLCLFLSFVCYLSSKNPEEAELEDILNSVVSAG